MKIEIKSIFGKVLFELEKENNTIKETLELYAILGRQQTDNYKDKNTKIKFVILQII